MRLQKYLALCGVASRRRSEEIIVERRVTVNGEIVDTPGYQLQENDIVFLDGKKIIPETFEYILLNKPKGVVSTSFDQHAEKTVLDFIGSKQRLYTVGRLDKDTQGLILLTNDGELTNKLTHPRFRFKKTYECLVKGKTNDKVIELLSKGVEIETDSGMYKTQPAFVEIKKKSMGATLLLITIAEGKKRQVRKMCSAVGHPVIQLNRIALGELKDERLKVGQWRPLTDSEIKYLKGVK